jgi:hypothetical protein
MAITCSSHRRPSKWLVYPILFLNFVNTGMHVWKPFRENVIGH